MNIVKAGLSRDESVTTNTTSNYCERFKGAKYVCLLLLCQ